MALRWILRAAEIEKRQALHQGNGNETGCYQFGSRIEAAKTKLWLS
jgi:hypothetical protein